MHLQFVWSAICCSRHFYATSDKFESLQSGLHCLSLQCDRSYTVHTLTIWHFEMYCCCRLSEKHTLLSPNWIPFIVIFVIYCFILRYFCVEYVINILSDQRLCMNSLQGTQSNFFAVGCKIMQHYVIKLYNIMQLCIIRGDISALSSWTTVFAAITVHNLIGI